MIFLLSMIGIGLAAPEQITTLVQSGPKGRQEEYCELPRHFPGFAFTKKDRKKEEVLCQFNFYKKRGDRTKGRIVGICPKVKSTNPAIEVYELPRGVSKRKFESLKRCQKKSREAKKLAKFKQSRSCSYTPSILAYYHFSRGLGNILQVPQSVYRTMDKKAHRQKAKIGAEIGKGICKETWTNYYWIHKNNSWSRQKYKLLTEDDQIFGAISINPRGERKYSRLNGRGDSSQSITFAAPVMSSSTHKDLLKNIALGEFLPRTIQGSVQEILAMRDLSHMYLMDHILSQADRFGNVHARAFWYFIDATGNLKRSSKKPDDDTSGNPVKVLEMMLRDNDCGIVKTNHLRNLNVLKSLRHFNPQTYERLGWIASIYETEEFQSYLADNVHMEPNDIINVGKHIQEAWDILQNNCLKGRLRLDLNIESHLNGNLPAKQDLAQCNVIYKPK